MAPARFGTDGVRGVANEELTAELAMALGRAAARILDAPAFVVGRDTRRSGPLLQAALSAGFAAEGADVVDVGVLPTPGVACVAADRGVPGAVVSASHNPFEDNGIKLFSPEGTKLAMEVEAAIERELESVLAGPQAAAGADGPGRRPRRTGHGVGRMESDPGAASLYMAHLAEVTEGRHLGGLRVVVDCAHGAASVIAPAVLASLGAVVTAIANEPDGANINDHCGSTDPAGLVETVLREGADLGLALDGDADRVIAVDHTGAVVDGDVLLALFALDLSARGLLAGNTVAVTVMTNLGFRLAMEAQGIAVRETAVGDRHVLAALALRPRAAHDRQVIAFGAARDEHQLLRLRTHECGRLLARALHGGARTLAIAVRARRVRPEVAQGLVHGLGDLGADRRRCVVVEVDRVRHVVPARRASLAATARRGSAPARRCSPSRSGPPASSAPAPRPSSTCGSRRGRGRRPRMPRPS